MPACPGTNFALKENITRTTLVGQVFGAGSVVDVSWHLTKILYFDPAARKVGVSPGVVRILAGRKISDRLNRKDRFRQVAIDPHGHCCLRAAFRAGIPQAFRKSGRRLRLRRDLKKNLPVERRVEFRGGLVECLGDLTKFRRTGFD